MVEALELESRLPAHQAGVLTLDDASIGGSVRYRPGFPDLKDRNFTLKFRTRKVIAQGAGLEPATSPLTAERKSTN